MLFRNTLFSAKGSFGQCVFKWTLTTTTVYTEKSRKDYRNHGPRAERYKRIIRKLREIFSWLPLLRLITLSAITGGLGALSTPAMPAHTNTNVCRGSCSPTPFLCAIDHLASNLCSEVSFCSSHSHTGWRCNTHTNRQNCANFGTHAESATQQTVRQLMPAKKAARCLTRAHLGTQLRCQCVPLMP